MQALWNFFAVGRVVLFFAGLYIEPRTSYVLPILVTFCCYETLDQKQLGEERVCFTGKLLVYRGGKAGQESGGRNSNRVPEGVLLTFSPCLTQLLFLHCPGPPAQERHHPQWAGPSYIIQQLRKCPTANSHGSNSSISFRFPLSWCVKLITRTLLKHSPNELYTPREIRNFLKFSKEIQK